MIREKWAVSITLTLIIDYYLFLYCVQPMLDDNVLKNNHLNKNLQRCESV